MGSSCMKLWRACLLLWPLPPSCLEAGSLGRLGKELQLTQEDKEGRGEEHGLFPVWNWMDLSLHPSTPGSCGCSGLPTVLPGTTEAAHGNAAPSILCGPHPRTVCPKGRQLYCPLRSSLKYVQKFWGKNHLCFIGYFDNWNKIQTALIWANNYTNFINCNAHTLHTPLLLEEIISLSGIPVMLWVRGCAQPCNVNTIPEAQRGSELAHGHRAGM